MSTPQPSYLSFKDFTHETNSSTFCLTQLRESGINSTTPTIGAMTCVIHSLTSREASTCFCFIYVSSFHIVGCISSEKEKTRAMSADSRPCIALANLVQMQKHYFFIMYPVKSAKEKEDLRRPSECCFLQLVQNPCNVE